jgi:glycine oxidase
VLPALAEARILEFHTQVRPALPDNLPSFVFDRERKVLRINGLYRHGFLLTPAIVDEALKVLFSEGRCTSRWQCLDWNRPSGSGGDTHGSREMQACLSS